MAERRKATGEAADSLHLQSFLPYRINRLAQELSQTLAAEYQKQFDITVPEWRVLATLGQDAPLPASEIGQRTKMDKVKVSRAVTRLVEDGFLKRRLDPEDARSFQLEFTASGRKLYERVAALALSWQAELLSEFSVKELTEFRRMVDRIEQRLAALDPTDL